MMTTHPMTTDMTATVEPCRRRMIHGEVWYCRRPTQIPPIEEIRRNPSIMKRKRVTYDTCLNCPDREPLDRILAPKVGWEPPPVPVGYKRKNDDLTNDEAWEFIPTRFCLHVKLIETWKPNCGCKRYETVCRLDDSPLTERKCQQCLHRKPVHE